MHVLIICICIYRAVIFWFGLVPSNARSRSTVQHIVFNVTLIVSIIEFGKVDSYMVV